MSSPSSPPLIFEPCARRAERFIAHAAITLGALTPLLLMSSHSWAAALAIAIAAILYVGFQWAGWLGTSAGIARIAWLSDGRWMAYHEVGDAVECELDPTSRVFAHVVWLCLRPIDASRSRRCVLVSSHALEHPDQLRSLIVRLRLDRLSVLPAAVVR
jgi:hypothetical protein